MRDLCVDCACPAAAKRAVALVFSALTLAACATAESAVTAASRSEPPDTGRWKFDRRADPVMRTTTTTASLEIGSIDVFGDIRTGELQLLCFRDEPVVRLQFNMKVGSDKTAAIAYRFDEKPPRDARARFFARQKVIVFDTAAEVARFVEDMRDARSLYLRITSLNVGNITARFPVHGARHAIDAAFAACPVPVPRVAGR